MPSSALTVTRTVTNGVAFGPSPASSWPYAACTTSCAEKKKPSSRGGCAKIQPTLRSRSIAASCSTVSSYASSSSSKRWLVQFCGGSRMHSTRTVLSSSNVPYSTPTRACRQPSCCR